MQKKKDPSLNRERELLVKQKQTPKPIIEVIPHIRKRKEIAPTDKRKKENCIFAS